MPMVLFYQNIHLIQGGLKQIAQIVNDGSAHKTQTTFANANLGSNPLFHSKIQIVSLQSEHNCCS